MSVRRTWDKDAYAQKAVERAWKEEFEANGEGEGGSGKLGVGAGARRSDKDEFKAAEEGSAGPMGSSRAFIEARKTEVSVGNEVGKVKVLTAAQMGVGDGAGFYCEVCKCLLKDDRTYISHINGKNHQRALGFSMRVERKGVTSVKDRLAGLKRKLKGDEDVPIDADKGPKNDERHIESTRKVSLEQASDRDDDVEALPQAKRQKEDESEEEEEEEVDPEMAALMVFGGFVRVNAQTVAVS